MKKLLFAFSAFVAAAACTAGAQTAADPISQAPAVEASPVACEVLTTATRNGVRFSAVASSLAPISGEYEFVLTKSDRNGSSDISQGGEFDLADGAEHALGEAELNIERRSSYRARLVLRTADGEICRAERSSQELP